MKNTLLRIMRTGAVCALFILISCAAGRSAQAQRWLQNVQVVTPVNDGGPTGALLDTVTSVLRRQGGDATVRRAPDRPNTTFRELEKNLLGEGLDFTSANQLFVRYRLEADERGYAEQIKNLYFIYRPQRAGETDVPIFFLDMSDPEIREAVFGSGTRLHVNEAVFKPFREQITFPKLVNENGTSLVEVGDRIIRDSTAATSERKRLMNTIRKFSYY